MTISNEPVIYPGKLFGIVLILSREIGLGLIGMSPIVNMGIKFLCNITSKVELGNYLSIGFIIHSAAAINLEPVNNIDVIAIIMEKF